MPATARVGALPKFNKVQFFTYAKVHFLYFINFTVPEFTSRDTRNTRKPLFPQLDATKLLKRLRIEEKNSINVHEVSGKSHTAKNPKGSLRFLKIQFDAKYRKELKRDHLKTLKFFLKKTKMRI